MGSGVVIVLHIPSGCVCSAGGFTGGCNIKWKGSFGKTVRSGKRQCIGRALFWNWNKHISSNEEQIMKRAQGGHLRSKWVCVRSKIDFTKSAQIFSLAETIASRTTQTPPRDSAEWHLVGPQGAVTLHAHWSSLGDGATISSSRLKTYKI